MQILAGIGSCMTRHLINAWIYGCETPTTCLFSQQLTSVRRIRINKAKFTVGKERKRFVTCVVEVFCFVLWMITTTLSSFVDHWHYIFIVFSLTIVVLAICGTSLDMKLNSSGSLDHYKKDVRKPLNNQQEYLLCFSTVRNWYRLTGQPTNELGRNLKCLSTFRYLT